MWTEPPRIGLVAAYAPLEVGCDRAPVLLAEAQVALAALPLTLVAHAEPVFNTPTALAAARHLANEKIDAVIWLAATWSFDSAALEFIRECPVPIAAWGIPDYETGSVCGSQQLINVLTELEHPRQFLIGPFSNPATQQALLDFARAAAAAQRLKHARFGMLGHRTVGMTEVTFHELDLIRQFGALVYYKDIDFLRARMAMADPAAAENTWAELKARCTVCRVPEDDGITAARAYWALRQWAMEEDLHGIAIGCYPGLMGIVCLACGLLAEEGIVTACEGDMNSAVLTAALHLMAGQPVHNTDFLHADPASNTITASHCGNSALSLARAPVTLAHARLMNQGVVSMYPGAPGRVTLANLCGVRGSYRLSLYTGEAMPTEMTFPGIPLRIRLDVPVATFLHETASFGAGHHWMIAYGDHAGALTAFAAQFRNSPEWPLGHPRIMKMPSSLTQDISSRLR